MDYLINIVLNLFRFKRQTNMHDCQDDQETQRHIDAYGLSVIMIEATAYLPAFAYSIGLWKTYKHPEIISFGLNIKTLQAIINDAADMVRTSSISVNKKYNSFFENGAAEFVEVHPSYLPNYFGYGIDFYRSIDFPAIQLVWGDRNKKFPWEDGFEEEFIYKQPLLDRNVDFKFRESKTLGVFTTKQWLDKSQPILRVVHDDDGDWQFLTGAQEPEDICIVALSEMIKRDITLNEVFNLDYGEAVERDFVSDRWVRYGVTDNNEMM